jgi:Serine hydrolase (FSH1)/Bacterial protein of unknown function (DUF924)
MFLGTPDMFAADSLALPLALEMVNDEDTSAIEKAFVLLAIQHAEKLEYAIMAEKGLRDLVKSLRAGKSQRKYMKLLPSAKVHVQVLRQFGRYCHRNDILGRPSADEEKKFLLTANNNFIKSVYPKATTQHPLPRTNKYHTYELPAPVRSMQILLLHGFRQNSVTIYDALKPMMCALRPYPIEFINLNSPMVYQPGTTPFGDSAVTHASWTQPSEHLRCWWNATDDDKEYRGWETSVRFIERAWIEKGGWDGVVAFGQGATLASALSSMPQLSCSHPRFAVLISGSPLCATAHQTQFSTKIYGVKTLNIYGAQDQHLGMPEEMKQRTLKLADCYEDPEIVEHGGGHFTPQWWPWDTIVKFIIAQTRPLEEVLVDEVEETLETVNERLIWLVRKWETNGRTTRISPSIRNATLHERLGMTPLKQTNVEDAGKENDNG